MRLRCARASLRSSDDVSVRGRFLEGWADVEDDAEADWRLAVDVVGSDDSGAGDGECDGEGRERDEGSTKDEEAGIVRFGYVGGTWKRRSEGAGRIKGDGGLLREQDRLRGGQ